MRELGQPERRQRKKPIAPAHTPRKQVPDHNLATNWSSRQPSQNVLPTAKQLKTEIERLQAAIVPSHRACGRHARPIATARKFSCGKPVTRHRSKAMAWYWRNTLLSVPIRKRSCAGQCQWRIPVASADRPVCCARTVLPSGALKATFSARQPRRDLQRL